MYLNILNIIVAPHFPFAVTSFSQISWISWYKKEILLEMTGGQISHR